MPAAAASARIAATATTAPFGAGACDGSPADGVPADATSPDRAECACSEAGSWRNASHVRQLRRRSRILVRDEPDAGQTRASSAPRAARVARLRRRCSRSSRTPARLTDTETPDDLAYRYSSSVAALIQYGIMLGILLLIARGLPRRELFALRRPASWKRVARARGCSRSSRSTLRRSSTSVRSRCSATGIRPTSRGSSPTAGTRAEPARSSRSSSS